MMRSRAAALGAVSLFVVLPACSSGGGAGETAADPVVLTAAAPTTGAAHVALDVQPTLTFSGALDPSSVSTTAVALRCADPYGPDLVPATVSYDAATFTITVAPAAPLGANRRCTLEATGLRDSRRSSVADAGLAFRTLVNAPLYDATTGGLTVSEHDADGNVVLVTHRYSPGADGQWGTDDDAIEWARGTEYDALGNWTRRFYSEGTGADGVFGTGDDRMLTLEVATVDPTGRLVGSVEYRPGPDLVAYTADDVVVRWTSLEYGADENVVLSVVHDLPGADATWFTDDDPVRWTYRYEYDAVTGRLARAVDAWGPGDDGTWFTADDADEYGTYAYGAEPAGRLEETVRYDGPGPDLEWFTWDDDVQTFDLVDYGVAGFPARVTTLDAGPDFVARTSDDVIRSYVVPAFAANGSLSEEYACTDAGADAAWFTADDTCALARTYETAL